MKVLRDGKEVKGARVLFDKNGVAHYVKVDGVNYDASAFELVEGKTKVVEKEVTDEVTSTEENTETVAEDADTTEESVEESQVVDEEESVEEVQTDEESTDETVEEPKAKKGFLGLKKK